MRPPEIRNHTYWKIFVQEIGQYGVVMANRRNTTKQIPYRTPPQAHILRHRPVSRDRGLLVLLNVSCPILRVRIGSAAKIWKQPELEMVVRVDQSRQQQMTIELQKRQSLIVMFWSRLTRRPDRGNPSLFKFNVSANAQLRVQSDSRPSHIEPVGRECFAGRAEA